MNSGFWSASSPTSAHPLLEEVELRGRATRKKLRWAYFRWLLLGSHYLYLRRPFTQILFWATLGGLLLWWLIDLARLPALVRRQNQRALSKLMDEYHDLLELRAGNHESEVVATDPAPAAQPALAPRACRAPMYETRPGAALLLSTALAATVALYVLNPPRLFPEPDRSAGEILAFGPFP